MEECLKQFPYDGRPHSTWNISREEGVLCICTLARGHANDAPHQCRCGFCWYEQFVPVSKTPLVDWAIGKQEEQRLESMLYDVKVDTEVRELLLLIRMVWGQMPHAICEQAKKVEDMLG